MWIVFLSSATYNCIQQLNIIEADNGSVSVQCVFVSGSIADGCHVIFTDATNGKNESYNITGSDNTTKIISLVPAGNYTVVAFEIINEKFIHQSSIQATFFSNCKYNYFINFNVVHAISHLGWGAYNNYVWYCFEPAVYGNVWLLSVPYSRKYLRGTKFCEFAVTVKIANINLRKI